jgi:hypothetical protein
MEKIRPLSTRLLEGKENAKEDEKNAINNDNGDRNHNF